MPIGGGLAAALAAGQVALPHGEYPQSGRWTTVPGQGSSSTTLTMAAGTMFVTAMPLLGAGTFTTVNVNITTAAATSTARLGVYRALPNWQPGDLLTELGSGFSLSTTGSVTWTPPSAVTLPAGLYWFAIVAQGASNPAVTALQGYNEYVHPTSSTTLGSSTGFTCYCYTGVTGALPASLNGTTPASYNYAPRIGLA